MKTRKLSLLMTLMLLMSMFIAACSGGNQDTSQSNENEGENEESQTEAQQEKSVPQVLNIIEGSEIPTMDSAMGTDAVSFQVMNEVFEGLYRLGPDNQPVEGVAINHDVSEDGLVYTFHLRDNAVWSNGTPVTAHDFVFSWQRAIDPNTTSEYGPYMMSGVIKNADKISAGEMQPSDLGVEAVDDTTLRVTLERPVPYFNTLMTFPTFLPQNEEFLTSQGDQYSLEVENLIYNGPFTLTEWKHEDGWVLKKNFSYWDAATVKLETINVKVVKDPATAVSLYETNQIDRVGLTAEFVDKYKTSPEFKSFGEPSLAYLKMNQKGHPALANVNIRRAISKAIDKQSLADVILNNGSIPAYWSIPKDFVTHPETGEDFRAKNGNFNEYNVEEAKALWAQGLSEIGTDSVTIELLGGDTETSIKIQEYIKNQLETNLAGLTVDLKNVPFEFRLDLDTNEDYQMQFAGWSPDYLDAMTFADMWVTDGGHNHMNYSNPRFDELINNAKTTLASDPVARFEAMQESERILLEEDAALAPLYQRGTSQLWRPYVKNVHIHSFGPDYSYKWASIEK
ncbi:peptide ABC transporter substrate-binding protein [Bacillus salitolerans]|uniref:Peptide ABC transporter substrate-binding protein n=1 Tax=Bacillus salitolerans TaxID=1437434 RepID=A0ABW4LJU5_9BACI